MNNQELENWDEVTLDWEHSSNTWLSSWMLLLSHIQYRCSLGIRFHLPVSTFKLWDINHSLNMKMKRGYNLVCILKCCIFYAQKGQDLIYLYKLRICSSFDGFCSDVIPNRYEWRTIVTQFCDWHLLLLWSCLIHTHIDTNRRARRGGNILKIYFWRPSFWEIHILSIIRAVRWNKQAKLVLMNQYSVPYQCHH